MGQELGKEAGKEMPRRRIVDAARKLFREKGFHSTPIAELAASASVSVGLIYRLFPGKDDIIVAIAEESVQRRLLEMEDIFGAAERGTCSVLDAVEAIARAATTNSDGGLAYEILAEAYRNPRVTERLKMLVVPYRAGIRALATLARPDASAYELDAYVDIMIACFFGLGHHTLIGSSVDINQASREAACLLLRALGAPYAAAVRTEGRELATPDSANLPA